MTARELKNIGQAEEINLEVLLDRTSDGDYYARVSEAEFGSTTDRSGSSPAEVIESALEWSGVLGLAIPAEATVAEIRAVIEAASDTADFSIQVKLYTSF